MSECQIQPVSVNNRRIYIVQSKSGAAASILKELYHQVHLGVVVLLRASLSINTRCCRSIKRHLFYAFFIAYLNITGDFNMINSPFLTVTYVLNINSVHQDLEPVTRHKEILSATCAWNQSETTSTYTRTSTMFRIFLTFCN